MMFRFELHGFSWELKLSFRSFFSTDKVSFPFCFFQGFFFVFNFWKLDHTISWHGFLWVYSFQDSDDMNVRSFCYSLTSPWDSVCLFVCCLFLVLVYFLCSDRIRYLLLFYLPVHCFCPLSPLSCCWAYPLNFFHFNYYCFFPVLKFQLSSSLYILFLYWDFLFLC